MPTIQVADKTTLDNTYAIVKNIGLLNNIETIASNITMNLANPPYNTIRGNIIYYKDKFYVLGGANGTTSHYVYKEDTNTWQSVGTLPFGFAAGGAIVYNNELHIMGGGVDTYTNKHYKWNGSTWTSVGTTPYTFHTGSIVIYNNEIHILGSSESTSYTKHYKYDGTSWTSVSTIPYDFYAGGAVIHRNEIHILGSNKSTETQCKHCKFNATTGAWTEIGEMQSGIDGGVWVSLPYNFYHGFAVELNNQIHILGGLGGNKKHYVYNDDTNNWNNVGNLPTPLYRNPALVVNNNICTFLTYFNKTAYNLSCKKYNLKAGSKILCNTKNVQCFGDKNESIKISTDGYIVNKDTFVYISTVDGNKSKLIYSIV